MLRLGLGILKKPSAAATQEENLKILYSGYKILVKIISLCNTVTVIKCLEMKINPQKCLEMKKILVLCVEISLIGWLKSVMAYARRRTTERSEPALEVRTQRNCSA